ncbi:hypothetical protein [Metapseudomonas resinovorans]|uniref:Uncharacterized protein n=1 Tax=Metapseudomonas resinovorans NBRC 106553 TaxID=1245471 RepID=S6BD56_METRE|nr:hypothetical protein [Pseudomonas resinovorans]BAN46954.1 hypothetical protein PCA10_12220 [Pseudomonas resinovorans NBRC 106553]
MTISTRLCLFLLACAFVAAYLSLLARPLPAPLAGLNHCQQAPQSCYAPPMRF